MAADEALARVIAEQRQHDAQWHYAGNGALEPPQLAAEGSRFTQLLRQMDSLYAAKGHDYGDESGDNLRAARELGLSPYLGVLLRMNDKMARLKVLARRGTHMVKDEPPTSTLLDLATYALLAIILLEEEGMDGRVDQS